jgi:OOP family OmpA-OmpF porin/outer membrane immunogenic protein
VRKTLVAIALAGLLIAPTASHAAGWFVNGGVGQATWHKSHAVGYQFNGGYRWSFTPGISVGLEGGYENLGQFNYPGAYSPTSTTPGGGPVPYTYAYNPPVGGSGMGGGSIKTKLYGWSAGGNARVDLGDHWYASANAGLWYWYGYYPPVFTGWKTNWYAGVGIGVDVTRHYSIGLNYDFYDAPTGTNYSLSTNLISFSAEYRF